MAELLCVVCCHDFLGEEVRSDCFSPVSLNPSGVQRLCLCMFGNDPWSTLYGFPQNVFSFWIPTHLVSFFVGGVRHLRDQLTVFYLFGNTSVDDVFSLREARTVRVLAIAGVSEDPCCSVGQSSPLCSSTYFGQGISCHVLLLKCKSVVRSEFPLACTECVWMLEHAVEGSCSVVSSSQKPMIPFSLAK